MLETLEVDGQGLAETRGGHELSLVDDLAGGVQALARLAGRSPEHVARQLRAGAGLRPVDLVTEARIDHAATRLALSEVAILDIALECGFDSLSHFYRVFRRKRGETPRAFRLRSQAAIR